MSHNPFYEEISSAESCIDTAELEDLAKAAAAATGYVTPAHRSASPPPLNEMADPHRPVGTVSADRRSYTIRIDGKDICSIASKALDESQVYRMYWEANNQLLDVQRMKDAAVAESKAMLTVCETLHLRCNFLHEQARRYELETKLKDISVEKLENENTKLKKDFEEYKTASKTLIRHMHNQNKKSKKQTP